MTDQTLTKNKLAFQLKGSLFTLTLMQIKNAAVDAIEEQLTKLIHQTPKFFNQTPIVLDCNTCLEENQFFDLPATLTCLRKYHLIPVGVRAGNEALEKIALAENLAIFPLSRHEQMEQPSSPPTDAKKPASPTPAPTPVYPSAKLITQPVRSGQQIYAKHGDLIILSSVSHGAELLADGNIHVYGTLRGRALAGVQGNTQARIFCKKLEPELIAIAGHYQLNDHLTEEHAGPVQIYLEENTLRIEPV